MELQIGEISGEISVDDLRLIIRDNIRLWNWGVTMLKIAQIKGRSGLDPVPWHVGRED